jgi:hypothetical protein
MGISEVDFEQQYAEATRRGDERLKREPRAVTARYDKQTRKVVIDLNNGCTLLVPTESVQGLRGAPSAKLADVQVLGPGTTIAWPQLDVQFSVTGLLAGLLGTQAWMAGLGRAEAKSKPVVKTRAVRTNGAVRRRTKRTSVKA